MKYHELLASYIKKSGYTLEEISRKLKDKEISVTREHLSRLRNGKVPPATDELNRSLAEVTHGDPQELILSAYIEKAPVEVKKLLINTDDKEKVFNKAIDIFINNLTNKGEVITPVRKALHQAFLEEFPEYEGEISEVNFKDPTYIKKFFVNAEIEVKITLLEVITDFFSVKHEDGEGLLINEDSPNYPHIKKVENVIRVPVLGHIPAGTPVEIVESIATEWVTIPNPGNCDENEIFMLVVNGDSMIGSRIYPGDRVLVKIQPEVENGEIAVVNVNGNEATLKKVKKYENGSVWLYATNPKYAPIPLNDENARIIGKVIQVIFEP